MALSTSWSVVSYVKKTTRTNSSCCFGLLARVVSYDDTNAKYTIELKPVVCASKTLFYAGGDSKTTLYANGSQVASGQPSPSKSWASESTSLGGTTYAATGYLLDKNSDSTPTTVLQGSFTGEKTFYVYYTYVGGTNQYGVAGTFDVGGNITLSKVQPAEYIVSYNANGGSGAPANQIKYAGSSLTLSSVIPTKTSTSMNGYLVSFNSNDGSITPAINAIDTTQYIFNIWNTNANGTGTSYAPGAEYTQNKALNLYAQYTSSITKGSITLPSSTRDGYTLLGWSDGTTIYTDVYTPTSDIELTAMWAINPPSGLDINITRNGTNQFDLEIYASEGIVDSSTILYREQGTTIWNTKNAALIIETSIPNLKPDTNYEIGMSATNSGYTVYLGDTQDLSQMAYETYSTRMTKPFAPDIIIEELTPFTTTISVVSGSEPVRPLSYQFSLDNGQTWSEEQNSNIYTFTNLVEETEYIISAKVITHPIGVDSVETTETGSIIIVTPADQAKAKIKINGEWKNSKMYIKTNGEWAKIKKMYVKKNGQWVRVEN